MADKSEELEDKTIEETEQDNEEESISTESSQSASTQTTTVSAETYDQEVPVNSPLVDENRLIYGNYTEGRPGEVERITLHIMDDSGFGTPSGIQGTFNNNSASSTYGVFGDGIIAQFVDERNTPWTDSNTESNQKTVSIEISNLPPGEINGVWYQYPVSDAALDNVIKLCADIAIRNNLGYLSRGENLFWHSDFSNKACPGDYIKAMTPYIMEEANKIIEFYNLTNINPINTNGSLSSCGDINIDPDTFSASRKSLTNANVLLEDGLGSTDDIDGDLLFTIYSEPFTNTQLLAKTKDDCLNVEDKVIKTIDLLSDFDTDMSSKFKENGELDYADNHEYLEENSLLGTSNVNKSDSVSSDPAIKSNDESSYIPSSPKNSAAGAPYIPNGVEPAISPDTSSGGSSSNPSINEKDLDDTEKDVEDTEKDVEDTEKDVEDTEKDVDYIEKNIEDTEKDVDDTEKDVEDTEKDVENNENNDNVSNNSYDNIDNSYDNVSDNDTEYNSNDELDNSDINDLNNDLSNDSEVNEKIDNTSNNSNNSDLIGGISSQTNKKDVIKKETILTSLPDNNDSPVGPMVLGVGVAATAAIGKKHLDKKKKEKEEEKDIKSVDGGYVDPYSDDNNY